VRDGKQWRFGRRAFSDETVSVLIAHGLARRIGDRVVVIGVKDNGVGK
jgi:hypothetical protein